MRLDRNAWAAERAHRLDHIGIKCPLRQELDIAELVRLLIEDVEEGRADRFALLLGIGDPSELCEKQPARIAMDQRNVVVTAEKAHDLLRFAGSQQTGVDKDAGQLVADRLMQQRCDNRGIDATREAADDAALADLAADLLDHVSAE